MLRIEKVSDEMAKVLADGFGVLVEVLKALVALRWPTVSEKPRTRV